MGENQNLIFFKYFSQYMSYILNVSPENIQRKRNSYRNIHIPLPKHLVN